MARPRFVPDAEQGRKVRTMAALGIRQEEIALILGLRSPKTLRRHFREDLDRAAPEANARVAQSLFQQATSGKNTAASIFWLKARAGWREQAVGTPQPVELPHFLVVPEKEIV
jgi:hypothetical protein